MNKFPFFLLFTLCFFPVQSKAEPFRYYAGLGATHDTFGMKDDFEGIIDDHLASLKINTGVRISDFFSMEVFYQHSNEQDKKTDGFVSGTPVELMTDVSFKSFGLDFKGYTHETSLFGKNGFRFFGTAGVGVYRFKLKEKVWTGTTKILDLKEKENKLGLRFGAGVEYSFDEHWGAEAAVRYIDINTSDAVENLTEWSVGIKYTF